MKPKIFSCLSCKQRFNSLLGLNVHLGKSHTEINYRFILIGKKFHARKKISYRKQTTAIIVLNSSPKITPKSK